MSDCVASVVFVLLVTELPGEYAVWSLGSFAKMVFLS